jgi:hypothetical protein
MGRKNMSDIQKEPREALARPVGDTTAYEPQRSPSTLPVVEAQFAEKAVGTSIEMIERTKGPRSRAGKQRASRNSIKHGIFSDVTLLPGESRDKCQSLKRSLWAACQPEGGLEELLVDKLVSVVWRHRRLLVAEGAEIRDSVEFGEWDMENRQRTEAAQRTAALDLEHLFDSDPAMISQIQQPEVLTASLELLGDLRQEIETQGLDEERDKAILRKIYGPNTEFRKTLLSDYIQWFETSEASDEKRTSEGYANPEECKANILSAIDREIRRLQKYQRRHASVQSQRAELEALRRTIPESVRLDHLLRYQASLERVFDRALSQLERIQRVRKGQSVAPRVEVDINS